MSKVLITGGTGLLGKNIVKGFAKKKINVYFTSTSINKSESFLKTLTKNESLYIHPIVFKFDKVEDISLFIKKYKKLNFNILINNARDMQNLTIGKNDLEVAKNFEREFFLSITLPYLLSENLKKKLNSIINISSMYGVVAPNKNLYEDEYITSPIHYGVSKSAQIHLTKELSVRLAKNKIRVNCVSFGGVEGRVGNAFKKKYSELCPSGRMLKITEVFEPIWFLSQNLSSGMTGHNLIVDGGWCVW